MLYPQLPFDCSLLEASAADARKELNLKRPIWTEDYDGDEPALYVKFERGEDGKVILPPVFHILISDELMYAGMKDHPQKTRIKYMGDVHESGRVADFILCTAHLISFQK